MGLTNMRRLSEHWENNSSIWVFGYGSLLWKPNFQFNSFVVGYIPGFVRRFWQGNVTHRGTPESPGRVATLIQQESGKAWGVAYELVGAEQISGALKHLKHREADLGGYAPYLSDFYTRDSKMSITTIVFVAGPDNKFFLGDASLKQQAYQIVTSRGPSGHNVEYITEIVKYIRSHIPEDRDQHLFDLHDHIMNFDRLNVEVGRFHKSTN